MGGWISAPAAEEAAGLLLDRCRGPSGHRCGTAHCPLGAGRDRLGSCCQGLDAAPCTSGPRAAVVLAAGSARGSGPGLPRALCRVACRVLL